MRAVLVAALGCVALAGCDQLGLGPHTAQAPAAPCHCMPAPAPVEHLARLAPPPAIHHRHHHRHYAQTRADEYYEEQSSSYVSQSRAYEEDTGTPHEHVWVDGYGRAHGYSHVTRVADTQERRDPWHGYKSKCGDRDDE